jgi:type II secretory ATPase GspE/PulE/Tfp pilus assembly ATPase PilB-like protein
MSSTLRSEETSPLAIPDRMDATLSWVDGLLKQLEVSQATESLAGLLPVDVPSSEKRQAGRRFAASLSHRYLIPLFDPPAHLPLPIDPAVANQLEATFCRQNRVAPLATEAGSLEVAIASPEAFALVDEIEAQSGRRFRPLFATEAVIERLLETLYPAEPAAPANAASAANPSTASVGGGAGGSREDRSDMRSLGELLAVARREGAARIHFERVGAKTELRLRCEGQLRPCRRWPSAQLGRLLDALKRHAKLAAGENRRGRSGGLPVRERGHRQNWPVEAIDTVQGERVLVELPTSCETADPADTLRLTSSEWRRLRGWLSPAPGLLLVGGPEEATRVATLTRLAEHIGLRDRSAIFLTRRPQCSVPGLHSIQIEQSAWNSETPMQWFRELPRQDLDLLLLEDLASPAALHSALQLASRGTLVIAGCAAANPKALARRLREWQAVRPHKAGPRGREPDEDAGFSANLAGTLHGLLFQRSVRNLCQYCSEPMPLAEDCRDQYGLPSEDAIYQPRGCIGCEERGYLGRAVLSELWGPAWLVDRQAARERLSPAAIRQMVAGTLSLADAKRFCGVQEPTLV